MYNHYYLTTGLVIRAPITLVISRVIRSPITLGNVIHTRHRQLSTALTPGIGNSVPHSHQA